MLNHKAAAVIGEEYDNTFHLKEEDNLLSKGRILLDEGIQKLPAKQTEVYKLCYQGDPCLSIIVQDLHDDFYSIAHRFHGIYTRSVKRRDHILRVAHNP